jgi:hypothetical protein
MQRVGYEVSQRSHDAVIRVYDEAGNVIETHEHKGDFKEWWLLVTGSAWLLLPHAEDGYWPYPFFPKRRPLLGENWCGRTNLLSVSRLQTASGA